MAMAGGMWAFAHCLLYLRKYAGKKTNDNKIVCTTEVNFILITEAETC